MDILLYLLAVGGGIVVGTQVLPGPMFVYGGKVTILPFSILGILIAVAMRERAWGGAAAALIGFAGFCILRAPGAWRISSWFAVEGCLYGGVTLSLVIAVGLACMKRGEGTLR